ncbi:unnamed protein product [Kuraishia capsulata CBS 1993]|uniref:Mitochondrial carrier protein n=1 Tax=Kuraishia capsulata CBS 1993 TaxID=1382522 RepID=W6MFY8_9ASCO|nr:uncharacterized protein KUCA_T00000846001 [Kuraishia capsulata CBS 1993]CDK24879.1 unnamed protein product [Kuraishia capsulata CBS 1993]
MDIPKNLLRNSSSHSPGDEAAYASNTKTDNKEDGNIPMQNAAQLTKTNTQVISATTAGTRAVLYQFLSLYLRTPAKLFRPSRFDYLATARILLQDSLKARPYNFFSHSGIAMLVNAVKKEGWKFIPSQVLPPIIANSATGVVLYTTYLTSLQYFNGFGNATLESPNPIDTFRAGFLAGAAQSLVAAPIDAIYARSNASEIIGGKHENLWKYGMYKLQQIGLVGVFAGFGASFVKESFGFAAYFSTFEVIKNQGYHMTTKCINWYDSAKAYVLKREPTHLSDDSKSARILKTSFILFAGATAAFNLLAIQYPINKIQNIHLARLEALDIFNESTHQRRPFIKLYYKSYLDTIEQVLYMKQKSTLTWVGWCYKGFVSNALTTIPASSIGLLIFEITRQRLSTDLESSLRMKP